MSYTVHPATIADLPEIVTIWDAAFNNDRIIGQLMRNVPLEVKRAYDMEWFRRMFDMSQLNGLRFFKAVDENSEFVGFAKWQYPHTLTTEQEEEKRRWDETEQDVLPVPEGTNKILYKEFFDPLYEKQKLYIKNEKDYYLNILAIHPSHQRQGIGSAFIRKGLEDADRDNAQTYIEASVAGLPLYLKFGWKEIDKIVVDVGKIDGKGLATEVCLMRAPGAGMA